MYVVRKEVIFMKESISDQVPLRAVLMKIIYRRNNNGRVQH